jgi:predicted protein tyrosine phosphatase
MYTTENSNTIGSQQLQKDQRYTHLVTAIYIIFHVYFISFIVKYKQMAVNLFIHGTAIPRSKALIDSVNPLSHPNASTYFRTSSQLCAALASVSPVILEQNYASTQSVESKTESAENAVESNQPMTDNADQSSSHVIICKPSFTFTEALETCSPQVDVVVQQYEDKLQHDDLQLKEQNDETLISGNELVSLMNNCESVLLLDCRSFMDFNSNHIVNAVNVNCSNRITKKRLSDGKISIEEAISGQEGKELYRRLSSKATLVVYDDNCNELSGLPDCHTVKVVINCLSKCGRRAKFLQGGLEKFQHCFAGMCTKPETSLNVPLLFSPTSPDINCDIDTAVASEILPFLYIGNQRDAASREKLDELGITHVVNVTSHLPMHFEENGITYKRLPATDSGSQNLKQYFTEAIEFIDSAKTSNGKVLVHCQAGVSRSPTIVIAYLLARSQYKSLTDAFSFVKDRRAIVAPNINFMGQLLEFEQNSVEKKGLCPPHSQSVHLLRI